MKTSVNLTITVQPKDTAYSLSKRYGLSVDSLLLLNNLSSSNLEIGQVLIVSPPTYTVSKGDTAFSIARKNGLKVDVLLRLNNLNSHALKVGQVLNITAASLPSSNTQITASIQLTPVKPAARSKLKSAPSAGLPVKLPAAVVSSVTYTVPTANAAANQAALVASVTVTPAGSLLPLSSSQDTARPEVTAVQQVQTTISTVTTLPADLTPAALGGPSSNTVASSADSDLPDLEGEGSDWLANAQSLLGVPYVYGGKSRSGTDCSGFVLQVFSPLGFKLPRVSADQAQVGIPVDRSRLKSGDLVFFDTEGRGKVTHVGIMVSDNSFINANSYIGQVGMDDLSSSYWSSRYLGARRVLGVMAVGQ